MDDELYAIFNRHNRKFVCFAIGIHSITPDTLYRKIDIDGDINLNAYEWVGDYDNGEFVDKTNTVYKVSEMDIEKSMIEKFFRKYEPTYVIMNIINTLLIQYEKDNLLWLDEPMIEMLTFYKKLLVKTENDIQFYQNSKFHKYITKKEQQKELDERFEINQKSL